VPEGPPDDRFLYLSDVLPTAWQAVAYADVAPGDTIGVWGLGPIGQMCVRIALHQGAGRVIAVDQVPERLHLAEQWGAEPLDFSTVADVTDAIWELTAAKGLDAGIDAAGMEAAGSAADSVLATMKLQTDKLVALRNCVGSIRRGGTLSISGVYTGHYPLFPLGDLFDKQISIRMGQANVRRWVDEIMPLVSGGDDPLGVESLATHRLPLDQAPYGYEIFQNKQDGAVKVVLNP
jgi:threonine dehydrogenase-like Zn-dependent dehydrogenase